LVVSLLSDFGLADGFVGALHSVLRARLPDVPIVDLTHEVRSQDVRAGSLALARAAPYLAPGVVVAVVDPGVGTGRRALAARAREGDVTFLGPDNGLLVPALEALGGPTEVVDLQSPAHRLSSPGPTFAGRDIFAPAAAHLAAGGDIITLGPHVGSKTLVRLPSPICFEHADGCVQAEVTWVDRYGNAQTAARSGALSTLGGAGAIIDIEVLRRSGAAGLPTALSTIGASAAAGSTAGTTAGTTASPGQHGTTSSAGATSSVTAGAPPAHWPATIVHTYADLAPGDLGALVDSYGCVALCLNGGGAAERLGIEEQDIILLSTLGMKGL
jgi:S-adenosylmethionine hydrolase